MKQWICSLALWIGTMGQALGDPEATHGMLLFGQKQHYASHLPMFHKPHDYQLILELSLAELAEEGSTLTKYAKAKSTGKTLFTLVPERMDLTKVITRKKNEFKAAIYDGHFERGGTYLGGISVGVTSVIHGAKLKATDKPSAYFKVFGRSGEYFGAHLISGQPTYDAIFSTNKPFRQALFPCGRGHCPEPVHEPIDDSQLPVRVYGNSKLETEAPKASALLGQPLSYYNAQVQKLIYVEYDELNH